MKKLGLVLCLFQAFTVLAEEPYIEAIKKTLPAEKNSSSESYTEELQKKLKPEPQSGYIDAIQKTLPATDKDAQGENYTEKKKAELEPVDESDQQSTITRTKEGHSELEMKRRGKIHYAGGFKVGATASRNYIAGGASVKRKFTDIYGSGWAPDFHVNFEFQPFHSEWLGNVAFYTDGGYAYFKGQGLFAVQLPKPGGVGTYGNVSQTQFRFTQIPLTLGANYRFNLFRLFRPYLQGGYQMVGYTETRSDGKGDYKGYSTGFVGSGGVAILMDWISRKSAWSYYEDFSIKHYYLVLDYTKMKTFAGDVDFSSSVLSAGFLFEL